MEHKIYYRLTFLLTCVLVFSCGKKVEEQDSKKNNIQVLVTGDSFLSAPQVWVEFGIIEKGRTVKRLLSFKAKTDGRLVISKHSFGLGRGCVDSDGEKDYEVSYSYKIKKLEGSLFYDYVPIRRAFQSPIFDNIDLNAGDLLHITMNLDPYVSCSFVEAVIYAQFK